MRKVVPNAQVPLESCALCTFRQGEEYEIVSDVKQILNGSFKQ